MSLTALSLLFTVVIIHVFHHSPESQVPVWLKTLVLQRIGRLLYCGSSTIKSNTAIDAVVTESVPHNIGNNAENIAPLSTQSSMLRSVESVQPDNGESNEDINTDLNPPNGFTLVHLKLTHQTHKMIREKNKNEWQNVARVLDSFMFIIIMVIIFLISLYVFVRIVYGI